jgi:hypothetical protein
MQVIDQNGRDVTAETIVAVSKIIGGAGVGLGSSIDDLRKATGTITLANNLIAYDLEAPAKNLYPVLTPIRNAIPRTTRGAGAGDAAHWVQVDAIAGNSTAGVLPWIPEGQRAGRMQITTSQKSASYKTIGLETDVTFEAQSAGMGFEDVMSSSGTRLLQQTMILEEHAILGGNLSVLLGTPATPTTATATTGGTIPDQTNKIYVFALTYEGYQMATVAGGVKRQLAVTGMDGSTYNLNGGSSKSSAVATQATAGGGTSTLSLSTTAIKGAVAYAWYVGLSGAEKLEAITTINSVKLTALAGTGAAYSAISDASTDRSLNTLGFDGLLYTAWNSSTAYYNALATGTAGTGTVLTASGRGTVSEIDTALKAFWDTYRISPEVIYVNAQELTNIFNKCFVSGSNPMVRFNIDAGSNSVSFTAGAVVGFYMNPYTLDGGNVIPIKLHPTLPAGTIMFWCNNLPAFYQSANVPQVAQVQCRRDYYQIPWPIVTRANATGVYSEEVLKVYAPFALGTISNIANG